MDNTNRIIMLGGIGKPNWKGNDRKTWMQGYRVYDSEGIAITISAKGGGIGSYAGLYVVNKTPHNLK